MRSERRLKLSLLASLALLFSSTINAEKLQVSITQQGDQSIEVPKRGLSQDKVQRLFSAPHRIDAPVGEPAITKWHYNNFIVYFENNYVIHAVIRNSSNKNS